MGWGSRLRETGRGGVGWEGRVGQGVAGSGGVGRGVVGCGRGIGQEQGQGQGPRLTLSQSRRVRR